MDRRCERHFRNHVQCTSKGFNERVPSLGTSKTMAMKRLASHRHQFQRDEQFETEYRAVIQEYLEMGHTNKVTSRLHSDNGYYLSQYGIIKDSSTSTNLRIVFDGSAPSTTGVSLNDTLYTGPKLQEKLFNVLCKFRSNQYVLTGDVAKMYRQFLVRLKDRKYHHILWRNSNGGNKTYQINTVMFGLSAAP